MHRLYRAIYLAAGALFVLSCIRVVDVYQPAAATTGKKFDVVLLAAVDTDASGAARGLYYGLLGIYLPEGWEAGDVKYAGDVKGRLIAADEEIPPPVSAPPGYRWRLFRTKRAWEARLLTGRTFEVRLKLKPAGQPGVYEIGYAAGAAPATGRRVDGARVEWESAGGPTVVTRWVEVN